MRVSESFDHARFSVILSKVSSANAVERSRTASRPRSRYRFPKSAQRSAFDRDQGLEIENSQTLSQFVAVLLRAGSAKALSAEDKRSCQFCSRRQNAVFSVILGVSEFFDHPRFSVILSKVSSANAVERSRTASRPRSRYRFPKSAQRSAFDRDPTLKSKNSQTPSPFVALLLSAGSARGLRADDKRSCQFCTPQNAVFSVILRVCEFFG